MTALESPTLSQLFEMDEVAWLESNAKLMAEGRFSEVDFTNLCDYLVDMGKREKREVGSRLSILMVHLLKWQLQPGHRSGSWRATIDVQREALEEMLKSATLRRHAEESLDKSYWKAVKLAVSETGLDEKAFPAECPFSLDQLTPDELGEFEA